MKDQKKTRHVTINLSSNQYELIKKRQESSNTPHLGQFIRFILFPKDDKIIARNLDEEKILINLNKLSIQFNQLKDQLVISARILEIELKKLPSQESEVLVRLKESILETNELLIELKKLFIKIIETWSQNSIKPKIL
ncbi:MAG: hypothetical protein ACRDE7_03625 [Sphingobacterium sp.]